MECSDSQVQERRFGEGDESLEEEKVTGDLSQFGAEEVSIIGAGDSSQFGAVDLSVSVGAGTEQVSSFGVQG